MTKPSIFLCASMNFYKELVRIEVELQSMGFDVKIPPSAGIMKEKNDFEVSHFKGVFSDGTRSGFIRQNFKEISESDSILVINNEKNGIQGYIGANVLMEIAFAFYFKKAIYIWNPIPQNASYEEELRIFGVQIINQDLNQIQMSKI